MNETSLNHFSEIIVHFGIELILKSILTFYFKILYMVYVTYYKNTFYFVVRCDNNTFEINIIKKRTREGIKTIDFIFISILYVSFPTSNKN